MFSGRPSEASDSTELTFYMHLQDELALFDVGTPTERLPRVTDRAIEEFQFPFAAKIESDQTLNVRWNRTQVLGGDLFEDLELFVPGSKAKDGLPDDTDRLVALFPLMPQAMFRWQKYRVGNPPRPPLMEFGFTTPAAERDHGAVRRFVSVRSQNEGTILDIGIDVKCEDVRTYSEVKRTVRKVRAPGLTLCRVPIFRSRK